jgi:hypothetical protein
MQQPQPFNSWLRDEENHTLIQLIPYLSDEKKYIFEMKIFLIGKKTSLDRFC